MQKKKLIILSTFICLNITFIIHYAVENGKGLLLLMRQTPTSVIRLTQHCLKQQQGFPHGENKSSLLNH